MRLEPLEDGDVPGRVRLEKLYHVSLEVPDDDLRLETAVRFSARMTLVGALCALLEFVTQWDS